MLEAVMEDVLQILSLVISVFAVVWVFKKTWRLVSRPFKKKAQERRQ